MINAIQQLLSQLSQAPDSLPIAVDLLKEFNIRPATNFKIQLVNPKYPPLTNWDPRIFMDLTQVIQCVELEWADTIKLLTDPSLTKDLNALRVEVSNQLVQTEFKLWPKCGGVENYQKLIHQIVYQPGNWPPLPTEDFTSEQLTKLTITDRLFAPEMLYGDE